MIIHNMPQRSGEWYAIRFGKITGSTFYQFMGHSKTTTDRLYEKAAEHITRLPSVDTFESIDTERGKSLEDEAIFLYEVMTNTTVHPVGFIEHSPYAGCSPDGLVGLDGMIEVKCPRQTGHLKTVTTDFIKPEYIWQIQYNLYITGRKWCDYISYCKPFGTPHIIRVEPDPIAQEKIGTRLIEIESQIKEIITTYNERKPQ